MGRLPLQLRLVINILIFSIPILVLTYLMYSSESVNIIFSKKEVLGAQLQRPYEEVLKNLMQIKISTILGKNENELVANLQTQLNDLKQIYDNTADELLFTQT